MTTELNSTQFKTMDEMAELLRISKATLSRYCNQGLPHLKVSSHHVLFDEKAVLAWFNKTTPTTADFKFDYRNVLIAPLIDSNSLNWYYGKNQIQTGVRQYITNANAAKHIQHICYFAPIINKQISEIDIIVSINNKQISELGYEEVRVGPVLTLAKGFTLDHPINTANQNGPGYSLNCLDIMLKSQGSNLSDITDLRNKRIVNFPIN